MALAPHNIGVRYDDRGSVTLTKPGESKAFIKLWSEGSFYSRGLQYQHKDYVDMDQIGESLALLLKNRILTASLREYIDWGAGSDKGILTEEEYLEILKPYEKYIEKYRSYEELEFFLKAESW